MSDTSAFMEPRNLTNLKNRPRSGSWSGYQYYKQQQQQQQQQQHTFLHDSKTAKSSFLSKFIQKRTTSTNAVSNDGIYKDDESQYVDVQTPPLLQTLQQPMLSTPLLKEQDHTIKRKKGKTFGRFLKKLGKNTTSALTSDAAPATHIIGGNSNKKNNNEHDLHAAGGATMEPSQMQVQIVHNLETQASDHSPNSTTHQNSIRTTTSMDSAVMATTPIKAILQQQQQQQMKTIAESTKDDIQLHYYRVNNTATYAPLMPRSTSFDIHRSSPPPTIRFFAPDSQHYYTKLEKCTSLKDARILLTETYGDNLETGSLSQPSAPEQLSDMDSTTSNNRIDTNDDDSTSDSIDSDMDDDDDEDTHMVCDRLSKRLSGGHFGSAGGLIVNTLSLSELSSVSNNNNNNKDEDHDIPHLFEEPVQTPTPTSMQPPLPAKQQDDNHDGDSDADNNKPDSGTNTLEHPMELDTPPHCDDEQDNHYNHADHEADNECGQEQLASYSLNSMDGLSTVEGTAENYARRIWEQDDTVYSSLEHVVEWIGDGSPSSRQILTTYMSYFDFTHIRLEDAFRQLCGKLSMRAESQQIDRILEEFSKRYWDCNQQSIFGNADVIHAVVYSLVLLNTDLHVAQGERKKMSRPAFIRNTMDAIRSQLTTTDHLLEVNNSSTLSLDDEKLTSSISLQSQPSQHHQQQQEWNGLKRTPSCRSNYSQSSNSYRGKISSTFDISSSTGAFGSLKWQSEMDSLLKQMYISIRNKQIMHPQSKQDDTITSLGSRQKTTGGHRYGAFGRNVGTKVWKMARESLFISDHNIAELDFSQPLSPRSTVSSRSGNHQRRRSMSSMRSGISQHSQYARSNSGSGNNNSSTVNYQAVASLLHHSDLPSSYTSVAPYYKEGMIARKHLMEQANQKARQRDWKDCFMVVDRGEIRMYRLENHGQSRKNTAAIPSRHPFQGMISRGPSLATVSESISSFDQSSISSDLALGGGDWLAHAQMIGEIDLKHTLSNALPSGYSRQRRHAFALQQANGGVYLFQVGSEEQVLEWVTTCNYWAARESKEPLMGAVGNLEYGWNTCLDGMTDDENENDTSSDDSTMIYQWRPPVPPMVASNLTEKTQLDTLLQHITTLNDELDRHRDVKRKMERKFYRKTPNHICAMSNFENKTQYLLHEIIKYQNYCDSIEKSLALQDKAIHEEQQKQHQLDIGSTAATLE